MAGERFIFGDEVRESAEEEFQPRPEGPDAEAHRPDEPPDRRTGRQAVINHDGRLVSLGHNRLSQYRAQEPVRRRAFF